MDKDAALNLNEFCIAMHLVVAVKHGVDLPPILPQTLIQPTGKYSHFYLSLIGKTLSNKFIASYVLKY